MTMLYQIDQALVLPMTPLEHFAYWCLCLWHLLQCESMTEQALPEQMS